MKKIFSLFAVVAMLATVACGPSAEDKAKRDKEVADSLANEEAMVMELEAAKAMAIQDSLANMADTASKAMEEVPAAKK